MRASSCTRCASAGVTDRWCGGPGPTGSSVAVALLALRPVGVPVARVALGARLPLPARARVLPVLVSRLAARAAEQGAEQHERQRPKPDVWPAPAPWTLMAAAVVDLDDDVDAARAATRPLAPRRRQIVDPARRRVERHVTSPRPCVSRARSRPGRAASRFRATSAGA